MIDVRDDGEVSNIFHAGWIAQSEGRTMCAQVERLRLS